VPNEKSVQDAVSAQLKYEINGEELNKGDRLILQQKFGLTPLSDEEVNFYLEVIGGN
jgi:hypothetical protein